AVASLIGGIFGKGGGSESLAAQALREAQKRFGANARPVFDDFRRIDDPEAPTTITDRFPFPSSGKPDPSAVALVDPGSLNTAPKIDQSSGPAAPSASAKLPKLPSAQAQAAREADGWVRSLQDNGLGIHQRQSNALLIDAAHSTSGHPIAVMGPQVGYYSPEILTELDLHGGGIDARGAAFPGISLYILLGRGADFAWSATTATTDNVDQFVEKLCEPDGSTPTLQSDHYLYKGKCIAFENRDKVLHTTPNPTDPTTPPQTFTIHARRSVHGPVQGTATVDGAPVAIANARSTYFHELDSALPFKRLNDGEVHDAKSFQDAMGKLNFLFNWFYADDRDIAYLQSGWFPLRAKGTDPSLPTWGTGQWDWQGFDPKTFDSARAGVDALPKAIDPKRGYLVSWNNKQAPGWRAADDVWSYGPVQRVQLLQRGMEAAIAGGAKTDLTHLTQIMEEGATGDLRGKEAYPWIRRVIGDGGDPEVNSLLGLLDGWQAGGAHRRDANGDGSYDESPAVALMDAWWPRLVSGVYTPELGTPLVDSIRKLVAFDSPPNPGGSSYFDGWWGYIQKDLRSMLGEPVRGGFSRRYCGGGDLATCRTELISTLKEAAAAVNARYGSVEAAKVPATCQQGQSPPACDQIEFVTAGAIGTKPIPWQNRPTFQQIVEVQGHRPR
ncbi:MAG: penicillin acylase family protein, partial [Thermoleophilaceae bacterium]